MKSLPVSLAACLLIPAGLHAQPAPPAAEKDPAAAVWKLEDGRMLRWRENGTTSIWTPRRGGATEGKWEADPFSEGIRRYQVNWFNGRVWTVELAADASMIRATSPEGEKITGLRVRDLTAYLMCNDQGGLDVNGVRMIGTPKKGKPEPLPLRSGDVLTLSVERNKGGIAFALEVFEGNTSVITAKDFVYSPAPPPDWQKTKDITGFRPVDTMKIRDLALGNITGPLAATPKGADEKFNRLFFKYVVP